MYTTLDLQELNNQMAQYVRLCFEDSSSAVLKVHSRVPGRQSLLGGWQPHCSTSGWHQIFSQQSLKHSKYSMAYCKTLVHSQETFVLHTRMHTRTKINENNSSDLRQQTVPDECCWQADAIRPSCSCVG